jgi:DNA-binding NtrC family response regulator
MDNSHVRIVSTGPHAERVHDQSTDPFSVFVVGHRLASALSIVSFFATSGVRVTVASSYTDAKSRLTDRPINLLITELQLGEYNGLGLVLRLQSLWPAARAIVVSRTADPVLQADAEKLGATFARMPLDDGELRAAALRTIFQAADVAPRPIRAPFERRRAERRRVGPAAVVERRIIERRREVAPLLMAGGWPGE